MQPSETEQRLPGKLLPPAAAAGVGAPEPLQTAVVGGRGPLAPPPGRQSGALHQTRCGGVPFARPPPPAPGQEACKSGGEGEWLPVPTVRPSGSSSTH